VALTLPPAGPLAIEVLAPGYVVLVRGVLDRAGCDAVVAQVEALGFPPATIAGRRREEVRNNDRRVLDDPAFAEALWERIRPAAPEIDGHLATGLNERLRFDRYGVGHRVAMHVDVPYHRSDREQSRLTLLVYLNDAFGGGSTGFVRFPIRPELGMALLFRHELEHAGEAVTSGVKYLLRTDVMYADQGAMRR
jgi:hypothetical protein